MSDIGGTIGYDTDSMGTVTVSGPDSTWDNSYLFVGRSGDGTLSITVGGDAPIAVQSMAATRIR